VSWLTSDTFLVDVSALWLTGKLLWHVYGVWKQDQLWRRGRV
jgi:hypothetical protein